jgi:endonuclease/exonuclease/phosphatase family metal-dependent hydrolase
MSGGFSSYDSLAKKPERLDLLVETIKSVNADFISLVDTHRWTEVFTPSDLKNIFGYENVYSVKLEDKRLITKGHDNGVTVLTRTPIKSFETIRLFSRNAIKTQIVVNEKEVDIFSVYLDDVSEDIRLEQIKALFNLIDPNKSTIFMGDLNTIDSEDLTKAKEQIEELFTKNPAAKTMEPSLREMMRGEVTKRIKEKGFIDIGKGRGNTVPSNLFPIQTNGPITRFDYAFCTPDIKVESFEVLRGIEFDQLSDHFPIKMRIKLD